MSVWRMSAAAVTAFVASALVTPMTPTAVGQSGMESHDVPVTHRCQSIFNGTDVEKSFKMGMGTGQSGANLVSVEYPPNVKRGEVFTAYVQPGPMTTASGSGDGYQAGRLSYDIALPANAVVLGAESIGGQVGISPDSSEIQINTYTGLEGHTGQAVRIWGGESVPLSTQTTGIIEANYWNAGLRVRGGTTFRFPKVAIRMRAPVSEGGQTIAVGLKGAGTHTSGSATNGNLNTVMGAHRSGYTIGSYWWSSRFYCSSSDNARTLTPTVVGSDINDRYLARTSTELTSTGVHLPGNARSTTLSAKVSTSEEIVSNVRGGTAKMRFDITRKGTGDPVHSQEVSILTDGSASLAYTFPPLTSGRFRDEYEVTATYTGRPGDIASSTSSPTTYSVGYNEINATVALSSTNGVISGGQMPVTVRADLTLPSGRSFPTGGMSLQLYRNGVAHGSPQAVTAGGSTKSITFPVDYLPQAASTTTYKYTAALTPVIIGDIDRYAGESTTAVAAIVTGTDPASTLPEGGHGSIDLTTLFKVPELTWEIIGGSVGGMGTLSTAMADG